MALRPRVSSGVPLARMCPYVTTRAMPWETAAEGMELMRIYRLTSGELDGWVRCAVCGSGFRWRDVLRVEVADCGADVLLFRDNDLALPCGCCGGLESALEAIRYREVEELYQRYVASAPTNLASAGDGSEGPGRA